MAALVEFEQQQPLLQLCASHWKADQILQRLLLVGQQEPDIANDSDPEDEIDDPPPKRKRTQPPRRHEPSSSTSKTVCSDSLRLPLLTFLFKGEELHCFAQDWPTEKKPTFTTAKAWQIKSSTTNFIHPTREKRWSAIY
jgi:hypothetical protein